MYVTYILYLYVYSARLLSSVCLRPIVFSKNLPMCLLILLASQGRPSTDLMFARWLQGSWRTQISDTPMPATQGFGRHFGSTGSW